MLSFFQVNQFQIADDNSLQEAAANLCSRWGYLREHYGTGSIYPYCLNDKSQFLRNYCLPAVRKLFDKFDRFLQPAGGCPLLPHSSRGSSWHRYLRKVSPYNTSSMPQVCGPRGTNGDKPEWRCQSGNDGQRAALAVSGVDLTGLLCQHSSRERILDAYVVLYHLEVLFKAIVNTSTRACSVLQYDLPMQLVRVTRSLKPKITVNYEEPRTSLKDMHAAADQAR